MDLPGAAQSSTVPERPRFKVGLRLGMEARAPQRGWPLEGGLPALPGALRVESVPHLGDRPGRIFMSKAEARRPAQQLHLLEGSGKNISLFSPHTFLLLG